MAPATAKKTSAKKVPAVGTRAQVMHGTAKKTAGGLAKTDLFRDGRGRIRSKAKKDAFFRNERLVKWNKAVAEARKITKATEFVPVKRGTALYKAALAIYNSVR